MYVYVFKVLSKQPELYYFSRKSVCLNVRYSEQLYMRSTFSYIIKSVIINSVCYFIYFSSRYSCVRRNNILSVFGRIDENRCNSELKNWFNFPTNLEGIEPRITYKIIWIPVQCAMNKVSDTARLRIKLLWGAYSTYFGVNRLPNSIYWSRGILSNL